MISCSSNDVSRDSIALCWTLICSPGFGYNCTNSHSRYLFMVLNLSRSQLQRTLLFLFQYCQRTELIFPSGSANPVAKPLHAISHPFGYVYEEQRALSRFSSVRVHLIQRLFVYCLQEDTSNVNINFPKPKSDVLFVNNRSYQRWKWLRCRLS